MFSEKKAMEDGTKRYVTLARRVSRSLFQTPARISILGFAALIAVGTIGLMLPASGTHHALGLVNALFTATSAACVTGLVVVDTGKDLTLFGQGVVLFLIQAGGLGIMTLSTLLLLMAGRRPSLAGRIVIRDTFTRGDERNLASLLRDVALFTFIMEGLGTLFMVFRFLPGRDVSEALYLSVFHSISAFCNAGFSVFSDSLVAYREDWILNFTVCILIISGGIGFVVLSEVRRRFPFQRRTWSRMSLHSKMVLSTTLILLFFGTIFITAMEWHNTLSPLSVPGRVLAGFFQSVSARTAGFNTLNIGNMANETLFILIVLMFIGASPGSCGGGIKTTALASLIALGWSRLRGYERPRIFDRTISHESMGRAVSVVMISIIAITIAMLVLLMTELGEIPHPQSRGKFLELLFEVMSAFGTVGLSTGITGGLTIAGKLSMILVMFVGRLGPLVIAVAVSRRETVHYQYAEEGIMIG
jgi:trk system potassium uptake protein TrkH